jgi:hypothetical protein
VVKLGQVRALPFWGDGRDWYLCISTMRGAEIVEYPDSGKIGAGVADPTSPVGFRRLGMFRTGSGTLDYWESEPEAG